MRLVLIALTAMSLAPPAVAQLDFAEYLAPPLAISGFSFGKDRSNRIRITAYRSSSNLPIIVFVPAHPASRRETRLSADWLPTLAVSEHMAAAWIEPHVFEERGEAEFVAAVADGVAALVANAGKYHFDPNRIILVGEGDGAQTAALLATDTQLLTSRGVPVGSIEGMLSLDGTGFDFAQLRARLDYRHDSALLRVIPADDALSPIQHSAAPNAARFMFEVIKGDQRNSAETNAFASRLTQAGAAVSVVPVPRSTARMINTFPGSQQNSERNQLIAFFLGRSKP